MVDAAVVVLADSESHADHGRLVNALETAAEFAETPGDDLELVFDGAGTTWIPILEDPASDHHDLYRRVRDDATVCDFCASAFGVDEPVAETDLPRLDDHDGHPSVRSLVADGYEVLTF